MIMPSIVSKNRTLLALKLSMARWKISEKSIVDRALARVESKVLLVVPAVAIFIRRYRISIRCGSFVIVQSYWYDRGGMCERLKQAVLKTA